MFAPYTPIPTNLIFFDRSRPTSKISYYEIPVPDDRKNFTKTKPIQFEHFSECLSWMRFGKPAGSEYTWEVSVSDVLNYADDGA